MLSGISGYQPSTVNGPDGNGRFRPRREQGTGYGSARQEGAVKAAFSQSLPQIRPGMREQGDGEGAFLPYSSLRGTQGGSGAVTDAGNSSPAAPRLRLFETAAKEPARTLAAEPGALFARNFPAAAESAVSRNGLKRALAAYGRAEGETGVALWGTGISLHV